MHREALRLRVERQRAEKQDPVSVPLVRDRRHIDAHLTDMFERHDQSNLRSEARRMHETHAQMLDESFTPFVTER